MTRTTLRPMLHICSLLVAATSMIGPWTAVLAATTTTSPPVTRWRTGDVPVGTPELEELDEVLVRGRRATTAIADLEDVYFQRYNKLNKDNDYDIHCSYVNTDPDNPGSALLSRVCMPEFLIEAMSEWAQGRCELQDFISLDVNKDHVLSETEASGSRELLPQLYELDSNHDRRITYVEFLAHAEEATTSCYQPPPPELVLVARTDRWYSQMSKVTASDPQLLQMAANLGDLYGQLRVLQKQAGKLEAAELAKKVKR